MLVKKIFAANNVDSDFVEHISNGAQHKSIQSFSHEEVRRIKNIVPFGEDMYDIVCYLGGFARAVVCNKRSNRQTKPDEPACMTHLDVRIPVIQEIKSRSAKHIELYDLLKSRAILFSIDTSRSRISGELDRLQLRRIYLPAFKAPLKRDTPIKIDDIDDLVSLLTDPKAFVQRQLRKTKVDPQQLEIAFKEAMVKPTER